MTYYYQVVENAMLYAGTEPVGTIIGSIDIPPMEPDAGTVYIEGPDNLDTNKAYDFNLEVFYYPKSYLHLYARQKRTDLLNDGVTFDSKNLSTDEETTEILGAISGQARFEDPSALRGLLYDHNENPVDYTNAQFIAADNAINNYRQNVIDAEVKIHADIESLDIEEKTEVDSAYTTYMASPISRAAGKGLSTEDYTTDEKSKLSGIASSATANDTDANLKNRANHTGTQAISTVSGLQSALDSKQAAITPGLHITDCAIDAPTDAATDGATNAATNATNNLGTSYGLIDGLLGIANAMNSANTAQNDLANKYNDLATKYNAAITKYNAAAGKLNSAATKYNSAATKINTLLDRLEAAGILASS